MNTRKTLLTSSVSLIFALVAAGWTQDAGSAKRDGPKALEDAIDSLKAPRVAWRAIAWKSCLLEGLKESREKNKPIILWVFIDRPADDGRC
jgi:hypothetical protein